MTGDKPSHWNRQLCRNFQQAFCGYGERCRFVHDNGNGNGNRNGRWNSGTRQPSPSWNSNSNPPNQQTWNRPSKTASWLLSQQAKPLASGPAQQETTSDDEPSIWSAKKKRKLTPRATLSDKTITVVTKTLLDDANDGFKKGNFVCSPLSLDIILRMLAAGVEGKTLKQLLEFLGHESIEQLFSKSHIYISSIKI